MFISNPVKNINFLFAAAIIIIYIFNLFITVMEVDAAQYASISLEMLRNNSYLQVFHRNADYLDKPPMLFWLASTSYKIFGVDTWTYKLPNLLVLLAGIYGTFRLAQLFYGKEVGIYAAGILASTQALFLITNDVRTDGILLGFTVLAFWQYYEYEINKSKVSLIYTAVFLAAALMAKGPLALIIFLAGVGSQILFKQKWKLIFHWQWLVLFVLVGILLLPMCYGLYQQFDLHPEKTVYDLKGPSGLKFFFWTQSFGRITGGIYWANNTSFVTFFHTFLWDFQPWAIMAYLAIGHTIYRLITTPKNKQNIEMVTLGAFILPFFALSLSKFKLPHYIFPLFPYISIILANFLHVSFNQLRFSKQILVFQFCLLHIFYLALVFSYFKFFPPNNYSVILTLILGLIFIYITFSNKKLNPSTKFFRISVATSIVFAFNLSIYFYPQLLHYQSESKLGKKIGSGKYGNAPLYCLNTTGHSLDFYGNKIFEKINVNNALNAKPQTLIFTDEEGRKVLQKSGGFVALETFEDYPVTQLNIKFLLKQRRASMIKKTYLLKKI